MNDRHAPPAFEWAMRLSAVLGMVVLFVLLMKLTQQIAGGGPPLPPPVREGTDHRQPPVPPL